MIENLFERFWLKLLDDIHINYSLKSGKMSAVEIVRDCITIFSNELVKLPLDDGPPVTGPVNELPLVAPFYESGKLPNKKQIAHYNFWMSSKKTNTRIVITCPGEKNNLSLKNDIYFFDIRQHNQWHIDTKNKAIDHSHFIPVAGGDLKKESLECLFGFYKNINKVINTEIISHEDINNLLKEFRRQQIKMQQHAKQLGVATAKYFIQNVILSFCLDFLGRYLLPLIIYHGPQELKKYHDFMLKIKTVFHPLIFLGMQLLNFDMNLTRISSTIISITGQLLNIKWMPPQLIQFFNLAHVLFSQEFNEASANEAGFHLANLLGSTSAQVLGKLLSNQLIHQFDKLKEEPVPEISEEESTVIQQPQENYRGLRQRKFS